MHDYFYLMCLFHFPQHRFCYIVLCLDFCINKCYGKPADFDSGMCDIRHQLSEKTYNLDAVCESLLRRSIRTGVH